LYAKIDEQGNLSLVNNLGINLGNTPEEMLTRLQLRTYPEQAVENTTRRASDNEYHLRVRDVHADTPSRFNNDGRRLYEASGCAGKIAVFAVRLDTYPIAKEQQVFYVGTNDPGTLETMRRGILSTFVNLPVSAEYMHRECYDVSRKYGKDTFWVIDKLGSKYIPLLFSIKRTMDRFAANFKFLPKMLSDILMQYISCLLPNHLPEKMGDYRDRYEHHLILEMSNDGVEEAREYLQKFFCEHEGDFFECTEREGKEAILHRFVAGGAIGRYHIIHANQLGEMMTIDVALRRNEFEWFEQLSPEIDALIENKFYYGHLFCHVMHQNYILKRDVSAKQLKDNLLASFDERRAEYPAEHNVGHEYTAKETLRRFYKELDPSNTFNPGIGKTSKQKDWKIAN
jgi:D-lactate dehydrogenase